MPCDADTSISARSVPGPVRSRIIIDGKPFDYADQLVWAGTASALGLPATVAPIGQSETGLPIGVQLIGLMFEDRTPIRFAQLLEREFRGFEPPPLS